MSKNEEFTTIAQTKEESLQKALQHWHEQHDKPPKPLVRPCVSLLKVLCGFCLWAGLCCAVFWTVVAAGTGMHFPAAVTYTAAALAMVPIVCFKAKSFVRHAVLLYQKYAPEKLRRACLFTPSCSEYMLLAIEKYGVVIGTAKGIWRLCRCHYPNGGVDLP